MESRIQEQCGESGGEEVDMSYGRREGGVKGYVAPQSRAKFHRITHVCMQAHRRMPPKNPKCRSAGSDGCTVGGGGPGGE